MKTRCSRLSNIYKEIESTEKKILIEKNYPQKHFENIKHRVALEEKKNYFFLAQEISNTTNLPLDISQILVTYMAEPVINFSIMKGEKIKKIVFFNSSSRENKYFMAKNLQLYTKNVNIKFLNNKFDIQISRNMKSNGFKILLRKFLIIYPFKVLDYTIQDYWVFQPIKENTSVYNNEELKNNLMDNNAGPYKVYNKLSFYLNSNIILHWVYFPIINREFINIIDKKNCNFCIDQMNSELNLRCCENYYNIQSNSFISKFFKFFVIVGIHFFTGKGFAKMTKKVSYLGSFFNSNVVRGLHILYCVYMLSFLSYRHYPYYDRYFDKAFLKVLTFKKAIKSYISKM